MIIIAHKAKKLQKHKTYRLRRVLDKERRKFPLEFPFWARMKISKNRTTLVIDDEPMYDKKRKRYSNNFVHREATHPKEGKKTSFEVITPNPDRTDLEPMLLKPPRKMNQIMFKPHNKKLDMPEHLKQRYKKNNKK